MQLPVSLRRHLTPANIVSVLMLIATALGVSLSPGMQDLLTEALTIVFGG